MVLTGDVLALGHDLHDADGLVLLHLVGLVLGLAAGLVVGGANVGADGVGAALALKGSVAHVYGLHEGLERRRKKNICKQIRRALVWQKRNIKWKKFKKISDVLRFGRNEILNGKKKYLTS